MKKKVKKGELVIDGEFIRLNDIEWREYWDSFKPGYKLSSKESERIERIMCKPKFKD